MGKYSPWNQEEREFENLQTCITWLANEVAETNRLTRLKLAYDRQPYSLKLREIWPKCLEEDSDITPQQISDIWYNINNGEKI